MDGIKKSYKNREEEVRTTISKEGASRLIEDVYRSQFDSSCGLDGSFDAWNQLLACEAISESTPVKQSYNTKNTEANESVSAIGSVNGIYKRRVDFELTDNKLQAISLLKKFNYQTSPLEIEKCLKVIFVEYPSVEGWWLTVGQLWAPRQINWVLSYVLNLHKTGRITKTPAAAFTYFIKHRKKRKMFRNTNDTY